MDLDLSRAVLEGVTGAEVREAFFDRHHRVKSLKRPAEGGLLVFMCLGDTAAARKIMFLIEFIGLSEAFLFKYSLKYSRPMKPGEEEQYSSPVWAEEEK